MLILLALILMPFLFPVLGGVIFIGRMAVLVLLGVALYTCFQLYG